MLLLFWPVDKWEVDENKHVWENDGEMICPTLDMLKLEWLWAVKWDVHY